MVRDVQNSSFRLLMSTSYRDIHCSFLRLALPPPVSNITHLTTHVIHSARVFLLISTDSTGEEAPNDSSIIMC